MVQAASIPLLATGVRKVGKSRGGGAEMPEVVEKCTRCTISSERLAGDAKM